MRWWQKTAVDNKYNNSRCSSVGAIKIDPTHVSTRTTTIHNKLQLHTHTYIVRVHEGGLPDSRICWLYFRCVYLPVILMSAGQILGYWATFTQQRAMHQCIQWMNVDCSIDMWLSGMSEWREWRCIGLLIRPKITVQVAWVSRLQFGVS